MTPTENQPEARGRGRGRVQSVKGDPAQRSLRGEILRAEGPNGHKRRASFGAHSKQRTLMLNSNDNFALVL